MNQSLSTIIYDTIEANHSSGYTFGHAKYGEVKVIMMKENSYINATKLCQLGNKQFKNWLRLDGSQNMLEYFCRLTSEPPTIEIRSGTNNNNINGTYPLLLRCHVLSIIILSQNYTGTYLHPNDLIIGHKINLTRN